MQTINRKHTKGREGGKKVRNLLSRRGETKKRRERGVPRRGETEKRIPARIRKTNCKVRTKRGGGGNQQPRGGGAPIPAPVVGAWKEVVVVPAVDETTLLLRKTKTSHDSYSYSYSSGNQHSSFGLWPLALYRCGSLSCADTVDWVSREESSVADQPIYEVVHTPLQHI